MTDANRNPWKMTTIGLLLVGSTAMVTTVVLEYRSDQGDWNQMRTATYSNPSVRKLSTPSRIDVDACKSYAERQSSSDSRDFDKGLSIGASDGRKHDSNYQAAYRSCMREMGYRADR